MRVDPRLHVEGTRLQDRPFSHPGAPATPEPPGLRGDAAALGRGTRSTLTWSRTRLTRPTAPLLLPDDLALSEAWARVRERLQGPSTDPARARDLAALLEELARHGLADYPVYRKLSRLRDAFALPRDGEEQGEQQGAPLDLWDRLLAMLLGRDYLVLRLPERLARAQQQAQAGRRREALHTYRQVLAIAPGHVEAHARTGRILLEEGRLGEAETHLQHAASRAPHDFGIQMDLGELYYRLEEPELARHAFQEASRLRREHADPHAWLGVLAYEGERLGEAAEALERAVQLDPGSAVARFYLAQLAFQLNDPLRAHFQLDMVGKLEPLADLERFNRATLALPAPAAVTAPLEHHRWRSPTLQGAPG